jgi:hypothetical protein
MRVLDEPSGLILIDVNGGQDGIRPVMCQQAFDDWKSDQGIPVEQFDAAAGAYILGDYHTFVKFKQTDFQFVIPPTGLIHGFYILDEELRDPGIELGAFRFLYRFGQSVRWNGLIAREVFEQIDTAKNAGFPPASTGRDTPFRRNFPSGAGGRALLSAGAVSTKR